jgi:dTMP kinase
VGERVREILLHAQEIPLAENTQALLFSAARAQLVRDVIGPALATGTIVVVDRFFDSTLAYQGAGHGADRAGLDAITRFAVGAVRPDRTFLLDVPIEVAAARGLARGTGRGWDRFEADEQAPNHAKRVDPRVICVFSRLKGRRNPDGGEELAV